jgi:uncharacterized SAM-binding protein YcdF (DUF218 family)
VIYQPKRRRRFFTYRRLLRGLGIAIALWLALVVFLVFAIHFYGQVDRAQNADVIVVLGAGLRPDDSPGPALTRRSNLGADLWEQGRAAAIICTGGITDRATISEAEGCEQILLARGVPPEAILLEDTSRSTEENALNARAMMQARGWQTVLLVSDSYHLLRAQWIFEQVGIPVSISPVLVEDIPPIDYVVAVGREVLAFHWQAFKVVFRLPFTHI